jgi:aminopeptidase N
MRFAFSAVTAIALVLAACAGSNDTTRSPAPGGSAAAAGPLAPPALASGRLPGTATPVRYALSLVVDPAKDRFSGDATIDVSVPATTRVIVLHARELAISRADAFVGGEHVPATVSTRMAAGGKQTPEELVLTLARPIAAGRAQLRIAYTAPLGDKLAGLYRVKDGGAAYAFTQLEPMDARRMLPCFDEPGFKVPFDVKVTTPKGNLVVANTHQTDSVDSDDGRSTTFTFATTAPLPTYLLALAVGPLEVREGPTEPVKLRVVTTRGKSKHAELALEAAAAHLRILGDYFARAYPYSKLDLVAVPDFAAGAMENAGLITFREELLLLDPASASADARRELALVVAHEIAHHWFGNLVTMSWWDDLWLNEGFATWMEAKVVDTWRPAMEAQLETTVGKGWVMGIDALDTARAVRQPITSTSDAEAAFDGITYVKGASVLEMIESWLGPDVFRDGVRAYIKSHEHGNATAADLFQALGKAAAKDVAPMASTFLDQPGVPLVRAEVSCDKSGAAQVRLTQTRHRARQTPERERKDAVWKVPVCIAHEGGPAAGTCKVLDGPTGEVSLATRKCPRWIYPNAEERGYYRFAMPPAAIQALGDAGKSLSPRSRIGLVTNAWALVQSGDLGADALLDLLAGMKRERHRRVIAQIVGVLGKVSDALVDDATRPAYRAYVSALLLPIAKELGWDARKGDSDETKLLRRNVFDALATLAEDPWLVAEADRRAATYLRDARSVDSDTAQIALRVSSRRATDARFGELEQAVRRAQTAEDRVVAVAALGSLGDPALLRRALDMALTDKLKLQDGMLLATSANAWPESRKVVLGWIKDRLPELKKKLPPFAVANYTNIVSLLCETGARADAAGFFGAGLRDVEGAERRLGEALETADQCIELRAREGDRVKKRLAGKPAKTKGAPPG